MTKDLKLAFIKPDAKVWASPRVFTKHGQCGMEFSDYLPHTAECADDICMIRSMVTDQFNHHPGQLMMTSGTESPGTPLTGRLGHLRSGKRVKESPRLRGPDFRCRISRRWERKLEQRISAVCLSRSAVPQFGGSGASSFESRWD